MMPRQNLVTRLLVAGLCVTAAFGARAQAPVFADYTRSVPVTIHNNDAVATPAPTSAEVIFPIDSNM
jgi:hypothetical protein